MNDAIGIGVNPLLKFIEQQKLMTRIVEESLNRPHGPLVTGETKRIAGQAAVSLCNGDQDQARTLWKLIAQDLGYVSHGAAVALIRAANPTNLVPDVPAPEVK